MSGGGAVLLPAEVAALILAESAAAPGREVCGLLFGTGRRIAAASPCANVHPDPARAFELDPAALLAAHRAQRAGGPAIVGHYHSHPTHSPVPSATDLAASRPGQLWLIEGGGAIRAWLARDGGFDAVPIAAGPAGPFG